MKWCIIGVEIEIQIGSCTSTPSWFVGLKQRSTQEAYVSIPATPAGRMYLAKLPEGSGLRRAGCLAGSVGVQHRTHVIAGSGVHMVDG